MSSEKTSVFEFGVRRKGGRWKLADAFGKYGGVNYTHAAALREKRHIEGAAS